MSKSKRDELEDGLQVNPDDLDEIDSLFFDSGDSPTPTERVLLTPTRIVALVSPKGGTGKTSIAVMLAGNLQTQRRKTGLMDLDPRQGVERWAQAGDGFPFPTYSFSANRGAAAFRKAIRNACRNVDLLILDSPSTMGPAIGLSLQVADLVMIPAGASTLDIEAAQEAIEAAKEARHGRDGDLPRVMVVPSRFDARTRLARDFSRRFAELEVPVSPAVGQRVEVAAAANSGRLVRPATVAGQEFRTLSKHVWSFLRQLDG
jgi:chromosome partitioning protein